jgi:hypothetical protein
VSQSSLVPLFKISLGGPGLRTKGGTKNSYSYLFTRCDPNHDSSNTLIVLKSLFSLDDTSGHSHMTRNGDSSDLHIATSVSVGEQVGDLI